MDSKSPLKSFTTTSFYSAKKSKETSWAKKLAKCEEQQAEQLKKHPIKSRRKLRVTDPLPVFEHFPRQQIAFDFAKSCSADVHVFAEELENGGKRQYIVSTLDEFWHVYRERQPEDKHYYEVITEGAACKLYFDLEFKTEFNQQHNGPEMVDIFIKFVCFHLQESLGVMCDRRHILDFDSSTEAKFSRHLIFLLPGAVFKDNIHAGNFVHHVCSILLNTLRNQVTPACTAAQADDAGEPSVKKPRRADEESAQDEKNKDKPLVDRRDLEKLLVANGKGETAIFCDQGVYTKNRNFRLYKSSKFGKHAVLEVAKENTYKVKSRNRRGRFSKEHDYLIFLDSLVSNVSLREGGHDVRVLTVQSSDTKPKKKIATKTSSQESSAGEHAEETVSGYTERSPYPQIDEFIGTVICKGDIQGVIRRWVYFSQGKLLMFDIDKNRWCENIGRQHKSNHIMMVVDLRNGVYYQKCHDPECRRVDYRSQERAVPSDILPFRQQDPDLDHSIEEELQQDNDDLCMIADVTEQTALHGNGACQNTHRPLKETSDNVHTHGNDACPSDEQPLDSTLFEDDDDVWEPWKDLPTCNASGIPD